MEGSGPACGDLRLRGSFWKWSCYIWLRSCSLTLRCPRPRRRTVVAQYVLDHLATKGGLLTPGSVSPPPPRPRPQGSLLARVSPMLCVWRANVRFLASLLWTLSLLSLGSCHSVDRSGRHLYWPILDCGVGTGPARPAAHQKMLALGGLPQCNHEGPEAQ